jgi:hypothetical protein
MITLKSLTIVAAVLAGGTSLAIAQNGLPTGGEAPVAGGAGGGPAPGYYGYGAPTYFGAPGYAAPAYAVAPAYAAAPGYVAQPGYVEAPRHVATTHPRNLYMLAPSSRHKRLETGQPPPKLPRQAE